MDLTRKQFLKSLLAIPFMKYALPKEEEKEPPEMLEFVEGEESFGASCCCGYFEQSIITCHAGYNTEVGDMVFVENGIVYPIQAGRNSLGLVISKAKKGDSVPIHITGIL